MDTEKLKTNVKRFFSNPNTLTFILVIVLIVIIYFVYSYMVQRAISPVNIPYANTNISGKTEITKDLISSISITGNFVTASGSGLIQNQSQIVGKYVAAGYQIPQYSFFYKDAIASDTEAQKTNYTDLSDNYSIYYLKVDFHSTYGNSIMPGNYIDLYFETQDKDDEDRRVIFEKFISSIQVLSVVDKDGKDVFTETDKDALEVKPTQMAFAVPIEYYSLLKKAELINGINLIPVPRNTGYSEKPDDTRIESDEIQNLILSQTQTIPDETD